MTPERLRSVEPDTGERLKTSSPLIAVLLPVLFVIFGLYLPAARLIPGSLRFGGVLALLLTAGAALLYLIDDRRHRPPPFVSSLRELAATLLFSGLVVWAVGGGSIAAVARGADFWTALVSVTLLFFLRSALQRALAARRFFVAAVLRAVRTPSEGSAGSRSVAGATREFSVEAGEASAGVTRARRVLGFFLVWSIGALILDGWVLGQRDLILQLGLTATAVVVLFGFTLLGRMDEEQRLLTEGALPSREGTASRVLMTGLLFGVLGLVSVLAASLPPLLSASTWRQILAWIAWLIHHLPSPKPRAFTPPQLPKTTVLHRPQLFGELRQLPTVHGSGILARILAYLGWSLAALAAVGVLWVLLAPLLRADYRNMGPRQWLRSLAAAVSRLTTDGVRRVRELIAAFAGMRNQSAEIPAARSDVGRPRRTPRRRAGLINGLLGGGGRRFSRGYFRIVQWAEARGVHFSRSDGPREYLDRVEQRAPGSRDQLRLIGELYERHLYSPIPLSSSQLSAYFKAIGEVVRSERA